MFPEQQGVAKPGVFDVTGKGPKMNNNMSQTNMMSTIQDYQRMYREEMVDRLVYTGWYSRKAAERVAENLLRDLTFMKESDVERTLYRSNFMRVHLMNGNPWTGKTLKELVVGLAPLQRKCVYEILMGRLLEIYTRKHNGDEQKGKEDLFWRLQQHFEKDGVLPNIEEPSAFALRKEANIQNHMEAATSMGFSMTWAEAKFVEDNIQAGLNAKDYAIENRKEAEQVHYARFKELKKKLKEDPSIQVPDLSGAIKAARIKHPETITWQKRNHPVWNKLWNFIYCHTEMVPLSPREKKKMIKIYAEKNGIPQYDAEEYFQRSIDRTPGALSAEFQEEYASYGLLPRKRRESLDVMRYGMRREEAIALVNSRIKARITHERRAHWKGLAGTASGKILGAVWAILVFLPKLLFFLGGVVGALGAGFVGMAMTSPMHDAQNSRKDYDDSNIWK